MVLDVMPPRARPLFRASPGPLVAALVALVAPACSTTAAIRRNSGPNYEASIVRSDADAIYVRGGNGALYRVPRADVAEIDHPGNGLLVTGLASLAFGAIIMAGGLDADRDDRRTVGLVYGVPGLTMALVGGVLYSGSTAAARAFERAPAYTLPVHAPGREQIAPPAGSLPPALRPVPASSVGPRATPPPGAPGPPPAAAPEAPPAPSSPGAPPVAPPAAPAPSS